MAKVDQDTTRYRALCKICEDLDQALIVADGLVADTLRRLIETAKAHVQQEMREERKPVPH